MIDLAKEIWQTMRANKLRTILTGISVSWGIFMLILLLAIANGIINSAQDAMLSGDPNRISIWPGTTSMPYQGLKDSRSIDIRWRDMGTIETDIPANVAFVDGTVTVNQKVTAGNEMLTSGGCRGVPHTFFTGEYKLAYGRFLNQADIKGSRKSLVICRSAATRLFKDPATAVGKIAKVGDIAFTVVGVYDHNWTEHSFMPFTTAQAINGYADKMHEVNVHLKDVSDEEQSAEVEQKVRESLGRVRQFNPADRSAVYTYDRFASFIENNRALGYLNYAMWTIGLLTLITGIVGVSNIMFVSVRERTHEIGVRRAIGAKPRRILVQIVVESVALTTCFGYIGIVMGTAATEIVKAAFAGSDFMMNPSVDLKIALEVTVALIVAGALAGLFPAFKALKVKPVEALRDE